MKQLITIFLLASLAGCDVVGGVSLADGRQSDGDLETVMGGINVGDYAEAGDLSTVNGGVDVGRNSSVGQISAVNGGIYVGHETQTQSVETVNGGIDLAERVRVKGSVSTVNGGIETGPGVVIDGDLSNVNGGITLRGTEIKGDFESVNGDLSILQGSIVAGSLTVGDSGKSWFKRKKRKPVKVIIGADGEVGGPLVFKRPVELYVHESAQIGSVDGAEVKRFSGDRP